MAKRKAESACPFCGSYDVFWGDSFLDGEYYVYLGTCEKCGKDFADIYDLVYKRYAIEDDNGNWKPFNANDE